MTLQGSFLRQCDQTGMENIRRQFRNKAENPTVNCCILAFPASVLPGQPCSHRCSQAEFPLLVLLVSTRREKVDLVFHANSVGFSHLFLRISTLSVLRVLSAEKPENKISPVLRHWKQDKSDLNNLNTLQTWGLKWFPGVSLLRKNTKDRKKGTFWSLSKSKRQVPPSHVCVSWSAP